MMQGMVIPNMMNLQLTLALLRTLPDYAYPVPEHGQIYQQPLW